MKKIALALAFILIISSVNTLGLHAGEDISRHWAGERLIKWQEAGYLKGDGTGNYYPDQEISRAEFASLLNGAMGYQLADGDKAYFNDIKPSDWYYHAMTIAGQEGYMKGSDQGQAMAQKKINRQEVMTIISNLSQNPQKFDLSKIEDQAEIAPWARPAVESVIANGYVAGYMGQVSPLRNITKAEAVMMIDGYKENHRKLYFAGEYHLGQVNRLTILSSDIKVKATKIKELVIAKDLKGKIEFEDCQIEKVQSLSPELEILVNGQAAKLVDGQLMAGQAKYQDGDYEGSAYGYKSNIKVKVSVKADKITKIEIVEEKEDPIYFKAAKKVIGRILDQQVTRVDASSGATLSSKGIMYAVEDALSKALIKKEEPKKTKYKDGEYYGEGAGYSGTVKVKVTIKKGQIAEIVLVSHSDDTSYIQSALNLLQDIKKKQEVVPDTISGATYSSEGLLNAVKDALAQALGQSKGVGRSEYAQRNMGRNLSENSSGEASEKIERHFFNLKDGQYEGLASGYYKDSIAVVVTVAGGKISKIELKTNKDDQAYFNEEKAKELEKQVIAKQSTSVDTISGATASSKGFINAIAKALESAGYTRDISQNFNGNHQTGNKVRVVAPNLLVQNFIVNEDLIITEKVGEGNLTLDNVWVKGNLIIHGGGENSIYLQNTKVEGYVVIEKANGQRVRLVVGDKSQVKNVNILTPALIETKAGVRLATITLPEGLVSQKETEIKAVADLLDIKTKQSKIRVKAGSQINHIELPSIVEAYDSKKLLYKSGDFELQIEGGADIKQGSNNNLDGLISFLSKEELALLDQKYTYQDGSYYGDAIGYVPGKPVPVKIEVKDGKISSIERYLDEFKHLKGIAYPDAIDDGGRYNKAFDDVVEVILKEQKPQAMSYKLDVITKAAEEVMALAMNQPQTDETYNAALDKVVGKHEFGKQKAKFHVNDDQNPSSIRRSILNLLKLYLQEDLGYDCADITTDAMTGATYTSKGAALAVTNALHRATPQITIKDIRLKHNYKVNYVENDRISYDGLVAEIYYKNNEKREVTYDQFEDYGLKVVLRDDETKEFKQGSVLNKGSIGHNLLEGLALKVIHPESRGFKLINAILIERYLLSYQVSKIQVRAKAGTEWIDLDFAEILDPTGKPYRYRKDISISKENSQKLNGKEVEFQIIGLEVGGTREKVFKAHGQKPLIWPSFPANGYNIDIPKSEFMDGGQEENLRLIDGRGLTLLLKDAHTLASEFKEKPKDVILVASNRILNKEDLKAAFSDLSTIRDMEFDQIDLNQPLERTLSVKLIFTDNSSKTVHIKITVQNNSGNTDEDQLKTKLVVVAQDSTMDVSLLRRGFENLPASANVSLENPAINYFASVGEKQVPVIVSFADASKKKFVLTVRVEKADSLADRYKINHPQPAPLEVIISIPEDDLKSIPSFIQNYMKDTLKLADFSTKNIRQSLKLDSSISLRVIQAPDMTRFGQTHGRVELSFADASKLDLEVPVQVGPYPLVRINKILASPKEYGLGDSLDFSSLEFRGAISTKRKADGSWDDTGRPVIVSYNLFKYFGIKVVNMKNKEKPEVANMTPLSRDLIDGQTISLGLYREGGLEGNTEEKVNPSPLPKTLYQLKAPTSDAERYLLNNEQPARMDLIISIPEDDLKSIPDFIQNYMKDTLKLADFSTKNIRQSLKLDSSVSLRVIQAPDVTRFGQTHGRVELSFADASKLDLEVPVQVGPYPLVRINKILASPKEYGLGDSLDFSSLEFRGAISTKRKADGSWDDTGRPVIVSYNLFKYFGIKVVNMKNKEKPEVANMTPLSWDLIDGQTISLGLYREGGLEGNTEEKVNPSPLPKTLYQLKAPTQAEIYQKANPTTASMGAIIIIPDEKLAKVEQFMKDYLSDTEKLANFSVKEIKHNLKLDSSASVEIKSQPDRRTFGPSQGVVEVTFDDQSQLEITIPVDVIPYPLVRFGRVRGAAKQYQVGDRLNFDDIFFIGGLSKKRHPDGSWDEAGNGVTITYDLFDYFGLQIVNMDNNEEVVNGAELTAELVDGKKIKLGLYRPSGLAGYAEEKQNPYPFPNNLYTVN